MTSRRRAGGEWRPRPTLLLLPLLVCWCMLLQHGYCTKDVVTNGSTEETDQSDGEKMEPILIRRVIHLAAAAEKATDESSSPSPDHHPTNAGATNDEDESVENDSDEEQETIMDFNDLQQHVSRLESTDRIEDSMLDPLASDPSCLEDGKDCWAPPKSTIETQVHQIDATCTYGGDDPGSLRSEEPTCNTETTTVEVDKHWGSDQRILKMRNQLLGSGSSRENKRPPIFLMPGLASTRLVAWRYKTCSSHPLLSDIKIQDYVWLNINLIIQMGTIDVACMKECMKLGINQTDTDDLSVGCKLRPDEGLDAISSLAPGGLGSKFLVGGTNTVYAWLIQWLADNLGYDVGNIIGLPYDWRLSPDVMEARDGFLTLTRRRIEAAVKSNGQPGIMVAHSMGNTIFRYFLEWLRQEMREEAYAKYVKQAERRAKARKQSQPTAPIDDGSIRGWMTSGPLAGFDEWWNVYFSGATANSPKEDNNIETKHKQFRELAELEGDENYYEWLDEHIWTYVGLSAPVLGAVNPLRSVISGENMGLPITDEAAREMEVTFGCTHTVNPISSKMAFCDQWEPEKWDEEAKPDDSNPRKDLFCLDDLMNEIENSRPHEDPWADYPVLKNLLKDRSDWNSAVPMMSIIQEECESKEKSPCRNRTTTMLSPRDAQNGNIFNVFNRIWKEKDEPLLTKRAQLSQSWWETNVPNILNKTWDRPHIKHIIMAYGVDLPTEVAYVYKKVNRKKDDSDAPIEKEENHKFDGIPSLEQVIWEEAHGKLVKERLEQQRSLTDTLVRRKAKKEPLDQGTRLQHSGDGTIPYLSLSWAHTWLLHAIRAKRHSQEQNQDDNARNNALQHINISHRPKGAMEWISGSPPAISVEFDYDKDDAKDTGTTHPHGTKYKPEMIRFMNVGTSRKTGNKYSTTVIEAIGVEHKETTRNYDILAAVFTNVLSNMHDDMRMVVADAL